MPLLARAKADVARPARLHAGRSESRQNLLCAYLSAALLVGLTLNAALGWWWADPATALLIAAAAAREGRNSWRGESCCTTDGCCDDPAPPDGAPAPTRGAPGLRLVAPRAGAVPTQTHPDLPVDAAIDRGIYLSPGR